MAKVLVTGAAGQVGSRVVRLLLKENYDVRAAVLSGDPNMPRLDGLDIEIVEVNLLDGARVDPLFDGVDAAIHTANLVGPLPGMSDKEFFDNNVGATFNVAAAAARRAERLNRLVHISSSSVYPNDSHVIRCAYHPVDELHPKRPRGTYALSKWIGEEILRGRARESGLRTTILRPSGIVSGEAVLGRWTVGFVSTILKVGQQNPEGELYLPDAGEIWRELEEKAVSMDQPCAVTDEEGRPWIYQLVDARDVARACVRSLKAEGGIGEAFNVAAPKEIPYPEAARLLADATGVEPLRIRLPVRWVFDLDVTKAKAYMDFHPRWGIAEMIDSALRVRNGEPEEIA